MQLKLNNIVLNIILVIKTKIIPTSLTMYSTDTKKYSIYT